MAISTISAANGQTDGTLGNRSDLSDLQGPALDLTVLGLNSGTSMVSPDLKPTSWRDLSSDRNLGWHRLRTLSIPPAGSFRSGDI